MTLKLGDSSASVLEQSVRLRLVGGYMYAIGLNCESCWDSRKVRSGDSLNTVHALLVLLSTARHEHTEEKSSDSTDNTWGELLNLALSREQKLRKHARRIFMMD